MKGQRLAVLVIAILMLASSAPAQDEERLRFSLPDRAPSTADLKALLSRRQSLGRDEEAVRKLVQNMLKGNFDTELLKQLQQQIQENPDLKKQVENRLLSQPNLRKQVESLLKESRPNPDQLREMAEKLKRRPPITPPQIGPDGPTPEPPPVPPPGVNPMPPDMPPNMPPDMPPNEQQPETPQPMAPSEAAAPPPPDSTSDWVRKQASEWASTWTQGIRNLDNETLKGIVEQIQRSGIAPSKVDLPDWVKSSTQGFTGDLKGWLPNFGGMPTGLRETLGQIRAPNLGGGNWTMGTPSLPTAESAGQSLGVFLVLLLIGGGLWVLWMTRGLGYFAPPGEETKRRLGPWPVTPDTITTRSQLVQCFEYLARRLLGMPAEVNHHHEVGRQMGQLARNPQQQQAAEELAELYEQARYTPPAETLEPDDLARARQALRILATVNPA